MQQILLIDSNTQCREVTRLHLQARGATVVIQSDADDLDRLLAQHHFDLVLCALDLPSDNGFSVTARVRMNSHAGVILIAADDNRDDRLLALTVGADHLITRPLDLRELDMLIDNLHRRLKLLDAGAGRSTSVSPSPAHWVFDPTQWTLCPPAGQSISLSLAEYIVLGRLLDQPGEPVRRDELLRVLDRQDVRVFSRNLDMVISRLRRKASRAGAVSLPVMAARGVGYVFTGRVVVV